MNYDFDTLVYKNIRSEMGASTPPALLEAGALPLFFAEMAFKTAPCITDSIVEKAQAGFFGCVNPDQYYRQAIVSWMNRRRKMTIQPEWIVPTTGTLVSITNAIQAFTNPGDGIIVQPPVFLAYNNRITKNGRLTVNNPMLLENGKYEIDFENLEILAKRNDTKMIILCNPQNPVGKVYTRQELERIAEISSNNGLLVVSDEIFAETAFDGSEAISFASLEQGKENCIVCTSLGKAFSLTGFNHANIMIPNETLRTAFEKQMDANYYGGLDCLLYYAVIAAYTKADEWLDQMKEYVQQNYHLIEAFLAENIPEIKVIKPQYAFLCWVDFRGLQMTEDNLHKFLINEAAVALNKGSDYGIEGECFARMNIAVPRKEIEKSLSRLLMAMDKIYLFKG